MIETWMLFFLRMKKEIVSIETTSSQNFAQFTHGITEFIGARFNCVYIFKAKSTFDIRRKKSGTGIKSLKLKVFWLRQRNKIKMRSWIRFGISNCILLYNYCFDWNRLNRAFSILILVFPFFLLLLRFLLFFFYFSHILVLFISANVRLAFYWDSALMYCCRFSAIIETTINHKIQFHSRSESLFHAWKRIFFRNLFDCWLLLPLPYR